MEKNLSIIQGLTSADQANPVRITDAGELKTVVGNAVSVNGSVVITNPIVSNDDPIQNGAYLNVPLASNTEQGQFNRIEQIDDYTYPSGVTNHVQKLLVDQAKSFGTVYSVVSDASAVPGSDIPNSINAAISNWTASYGPRYDDIIITPYAANGGGSSIKFLVGITIIRYY